MLASHAAVIVDVVWWPGMGDLGMGPGDLGMRVWWHGNEGLVAWE